MANPTSSLQAKGGPCAPCSNKTRQERPCKGARVRYRRLVESTISEIEKNPAIFSIDDLEHNLPSEVKKNLWLKQKFLRRMENLKHISLAEQPQLMSVPASVEVQDGVNKALAEHSTNREEPPKFSFEPMKAIMDHRGHEEQGFVVWTDNGRAPVGVFHGEGYDVPARTVNYPRVQHISMPWKLLSREATARNPEA